MIIDFLKEKKSGRLLYHIYSDLEFRCDILAKGSD